MDNVMQVLCQCCYPIFPTNMLTEGQGLMMGGLQCPHTVTQCPVINHIFAGPAKCVISGGMCSHCCQQTSLSGHNCHNGGGSLLLPLSRWCHVPPSTQFIWAPLGVKYSSLKGASPQGSIHHQMVSESWNVTGRAQMCALRQKCF